MWNTTLPPTNREVQVNEYGFIRAFWQDPTWWWVSIDSFGQECYSAGPTPNAWKELDDQTIPVNLGTKL